MPTSSATSPTAKMRLPHQSIRAGRRSPLSRSIRKAQTVPKRPTGTETRKTSCQAIGPSTPPSTRPMNDPAIAATMLVPRAMPRWCGGKASVRMALELASSIAPPTPWRIRITIM